jgi:anti-anti-sigma factor
MTIALSLTAGPELCIAQAAQIQADWLQLLAGTEAGQPCEVQLDLSGVESFDSAGLQLLLALKLRLEQQGGQLVLASPGAAVRDALGVFGLDESLRPTAGTIGAAS